MGEQKPTLEYRTPPPRPQRTRFTRRGIELSRTGMTIGVLGASAIWAGIAGFYRGQGNAELGALIIVGVLGVLASSRLFRSAMRMVEPTGDPPSKAPGAKPAAEKKSKIS